MFIIHLQKKQILKTNNTCTINMCGILALFGEDVEVSSYLLTHRGPDDYRSKTLGKCRMDFYRLAINDLTDAGMQPFRQGDHMLVCNGEIFNYREHLTVAYQHVITLSEGLHTRISEVIDRETIKIHSAFT